MLEPLVSSKWLKDYFNRQQVLQNSVLDRLSKAGFLGLTQDQFMSLLNGQDPFCGRTPIDFRAAREILGDGNTYSFEEALKSDLNFPHIDEPVKVRYSEETLLEAISENNNPLIQNKWKLIYCSGISIISQEELFGEYVASHPWGEWKELRQEAGYYLINFRGWFTGSSWLSQERSLRSDEYERYSRVSPNILIEVFRAFRRSKRTDKLPRVRHWSDVVGDSLDEYLLFDCGPKAVKIYSEDKHQAPNSDSLDEAGPYSAVHVCRKFDF